MIPESGSLIWVKRFAHAADGESLREMHGAKKLPDRPKLGRCGGARAAVTVLAYRNQALVAHASISTSKSGEASPSVITKVEAGKVSSPITLRRAARYSSIKRASVR